MEKFKQDVYTFFSYLMPKNILITDILEIILIAYFIYTIINWIKDTKAWSLFKGIVFLMAMWIIAELLNFNVILYIFVNAINVGIIALFIIFQPELRRALEQLGRKNISVFQFDFRNEKVRFSNNTVQEIVVACNHMSEKKTGALIVLENETSLGEYEMTGIELDSNISAALLINIFEHNTPLHDGAVIIKGDKIKAATCILPVSDNMSLSRDLGTRHRAGIGLSEVTDAFVIIVSEENGKISIAVNGQLIRNVDEMYLRSRLQKLQKINDVTETRKLTLHRKRKKNSREKKEI
ncbi:MAG: diadenylate cyclase CdaA [Lachnospiraceae bacterium]|nr:diadenylate cyclase CdaA [Lachnospiraceae bacterium]